MRKKIDCKLLRLCVVFLSFLFSISLSAQTRVTGKVISGKDNTPVGYATITAKGTKVATSTDASGNFTLSLPAGVTSVVVTSVGYTTTEADASSGTVSVTLTENSGALDEIVVTGYTAQRKKDLTGAVAVVNVSSVKQIPAGTVESQLQGQAAGVTVINSGLPGGGSNFRVRGITSTGDNSPLFIVDGVQVGSIQDLNPQDIESIQVLKDAGSAAIYGVRGSNGVIIVTTKRGRGKPNVNYNAYIGVQQPLKGYDLATPQETADALWQAQINEGLTPSSKQYGNGASPVLPDYLTPTAGKEGDPNTLPSAYVFNPGNINKNIANDNRITKANKAGTDWWGAIFDPAMQQHHSITASGSSDKSNYLFSVEYLNQQGTLLNTYLKRYSVRANTNFNISDHIRIGENAYIFYKQNPGFTNQNEGNALSYSYREQRIIPIYDIMGNFAGTGSADLGNSNNPYATASRTADNKSNNWSVVGNVYAEADIINHLTARTQFGGNFENYYYYNFTYTAYENAEGNTNANGYTEGSGYNSNWTWTNTLRYNNTFGKHNVSLLGGVEAVDNFGRSLAASRGNYAFTNPSYWTLNSGSPSGQSNSGSISTDNSLFSMFGRLDYSFNDRYLVSATIRRDGSSKLSKDNRYGVFPSFSGAWRISQENFMKNVSFFNDLKIRGSWGKLGSINNLISTNASILYRAFASNSFYNITGSGTSATLGFYNSQLSNPGAKWEEDVLTNLGFDATILKSKIDISFDVYKKAINGLLFQPSIPNTIGGPAAPYVNLGNIQNTGIDASVGYHFTVAKDFNINLAGTFTTYKNEVKTLPDGTNYIDVNSAGSTRIGSFSRIQPGHPVGAFFGYKVIGYFSSADDVAKSPTQDGAEPGFFKYEDVNNDGKINDADRTFIGDPNPKFTYGFNLSANYKNFDISMFLYGSQGNDAFNYIKYWTDFYQVFQGAISKDAVNNSWTPDNLNPAVPKLSTKATFSNTTAINSWYVENGSYLRCKQLQFGYTLPAAPLKRIGVTSFRIYAQVANLFTITKYSGLDPELQGAASGNSQSAVLSSTSFGIDLGNYPSNQKTYLIGVNLNF